MSELARLLVAESTPETNLLDDATVEVYREEMGRPTRIADACERLDRRWRVVGEALRRLGAEISTEAANA